MPVVPLNRAMALIVIVALMSSLAAPLTGIAVPAASSAEKTPAGAAYVTLEKSAVAVPSDGSFSLKVHVTADRPTSYLESRVQIRRPSGSLLFQDTEIQHDVETGTAIFEYERELADLELDAEAYPIEVRVRSDSGEVREWIVADDLLVYDPSAEPVPLTLIVRTGCAIGSDAQGRFALDPSAASRTRDEVEALSSLVLSNQELQVGVAIPPVTLEEWQRVSQGYEFAGPEGVEVVPGDSDVAADHTATLSLLQSALASRRMHLSDVPYADPDILGLQTMGRLQDLAPQYERGLSAYFASIEATPQPYTMTANGLLPADTLGQLITRDIVAAVVSSASIESGEAQLPGAYTAGDSGVGLLVLDDEASSALGSAEATTFARSVFDHQINAEGGTPLIAEVTIGPGSHASVASVEEALSEVASAPWVEMISPLEAATLAKGDAALVSEMAAESDAPPGYWEEVAEARKKAAGLVSAAGVNDPQAQLAADASLIAESRCWAGPDASWSHADRGRAFAGAAARISDDILAGIHVAAKDVTLAGAQGEVPISIVSPSEKTLSATLKTTSDGLSVEGPASQLITLRPGENVLTIPVDLQSSIAGDLKIEVWADELPIAEAEVAVKASLIDRLAIIGGIVIVLVGMLLYIRRRVRRASADTMHDEG